MSTRILHLALFLLVSVPSLSFAFECIDHADYDRTLVRHTDLEGSVYLCRVGDLVYTVNGLYGLFVVDISDVLNPVTIASLETPGWARAVTVVGDLAYIADEIGGVAVIDVSDPADPVLITSVPTDSFAMDLLVDEGVLYVADFSSGLRVFDLTDPAAPVFLATRDTEGGARGLDKVADHLYIAGQGSGLYVFDVSDPATPLLRGLAALEGTGNAVTVSDGYAYVGGSTNPLTVIDVSDPQLPTVVADLFVRGAGYRSELVGDLLYLATSGGLFRIDVSDPLNPAYKGHNLTPGSSLDVIILDDDLALLADGSSLLVTDIADMLPLAEPEYFEVPGYQRGLAIDESFAYLASYGDGLQIVDISDPRDPMLVGAVATADTAEGIAVAGDLAVVLDQQAGLSTIDVSDRAHPVLLNTLPLPYGTSRISLADGRAYPGSSGSPNLVIVDVEDPSQPTVICDQPVAGPVWDVAVQGDLAYVAAAYSGLLVYDVSIPGTPLLISEGSVPYSLSVTLADGHAFLFKPGTESQLWVVDIADPANPVHVTSVSLPDAYYRMTVHAGTAYATSGSSPGTAIIDVSIPAQARLLYHRAFPTWTGQAAATDGALLVIAHPGLAIMPLQCPNGWGLGQNGPGSSPVLLQQNTPNPFNPHTTIAFDLDRPQRASLRVFDLAGRLVRTLVDGEPLMGGSHRRDWNGRNGAGRPVAAGVYFYRLDTDRTSETRRMMLVK